MEVFRAWHTEKLAARSLSLLCPGCGKRGTFENSGDDYNALLPKSGPPQFREFRFGFRRCPDPECHAIVAVWMQGLKISQFPVGLIEFDRSGIPQHVTDAFAEALKCLAHKCYIASAIMVRKTLELMCDDRGAGGANLKAKIADLKNKIVISQELIDGADHLRLLGNDAAHVNASIFAQIGEDELTVAIDLTKELLEAAYSHADLVARLKALKK